MRSKLLLIALGSTVAACTTPYDEPDRGVHSVNIPVVTSADYTFDASAPTGALASGETERLNGWFQGLGVGYGDTIYVDGAYAPVAREQIAHVAANYGLAIQPGAPVTMGAVQPGAVRVVVSRRRAEVPGCPNWSVPAAPNWTERSMSNYGCSVNANLAAQVANPDDLLHGREGSAITDAQTGSKAVQFYRATPPSGAKGLQDISTKKEDK